MKISDLKPGYILRGNDKYIILGISSTYTVELFNLNTEEEETLEGDYLEEGDISHYDFTMITVEEYLWKASEMFKEKFLKTYSELKSFYEF